MRVSLHIRGQGWLELRPRFRKVTRPALFRMKLRIASTYVMRPCCQL